MTEVCISRFRYSFPIPGRIRELHGVKREVGFFQWLEDCNLIEHRDYYIAMFDHNTVVLFRDLTVAMLFKLRWGGL